MKLGNEDGDGERLLAACLLHSGSLFGQLLFFGFIKAFISFPIQDGPVCFQGFGFFFLRKQKNAQNPEMSFLIERV